MSRTDISAASLADYLRRKAGDGSIEWCHKPMQTRVLLDVADMLDENAKLRELVLIAVKYCDSGTCDGCPIIGEDESCPYLDMARELGVEVYG